VQLEFEDTFQGVLLDERKWLPYYLAHWSSRQRSTARYTLGAGSLRLRIDGDQQPWCPEFDGNVRVSSLQTGALSGPLGSAVGQCHFRPDLVVREAQPEVRLYTPEYALIEMRARASIDSQSMVALWMIGFQDAPSRSAEICVCEIFGRDVRPHRAAVGMGLHPFGDPRIRDEFAAEALAIDVREFHTYAADWTPDHVTFVVDGQPIKTVHQSPQYSMQLMLGIYDFAGEASGTYPKEFIVDYVRGYRQA
jgi:Glycosyl hydrolases family 16